MVLSGSFARSLDEKQRLAVPKRICEDFGDAELNSFYVAPGTDKSLVLYSPAGFDRLARKIAKKSSNRAEVRNYKRLFYARAERVELDAQGRIRIPERLIEFAELGRDVVIAGVHDHAEIWNAARWSSFLETSAGAFDDMAQEAFE